MDSSLQMLPKTKPGMWWVRAMTYEDFWWLLYGRGRGIIYTYMCVCIYTACRYTCLFFKRYIFDYSIQIIYKYENNIHNNSMYIYIPTTALWTSKRHHPSCHCEPGLTTRVFEAITGGISWEDALKPLRTLLAKKCAKGQEDPGVRMGWYWRLGLCMAWLSRNIIWGLN